MRFDPMAFFDGFVDYLKTERASTLAYLSVMAANEHWIQFEATDWLHRHRDCVGLGGYNGRTPECDVLPEKRKIDIWLQDHRGTSNRKGIGIEFKLIYNNKNWGSQIKSLRQDLSGAKQPPDGFAPDQVTRYGVSGGSWLLRWRSVSRLSFSFDGTISGFSSTQLRSSS